MPALWVPSAFRCFCFASFCLLLCNSVRSYIKNCAQISLSQSVSLARHIQAHISIYKYMCVYVYLYIYIFLYVLPV